MVRTTKAIDVTNLPELRRIAEEVRQSGEPYLLRTGSDAVAAVVPLDDTGDAPRTRTQADREAFLSAFGGWKGNVDTHKLKAGLRAGRSSDRPPVEL